MTALLKNSENRLQIISKKIHDGENGTNEELNKIINDIMELRRGELLQVNNILNCIELYCIVLY